MHRSLRLLMIAAGIAVMVTILLNRAQKSSEKPLPNNLIAFVSDRDSNLEIYITDPLGEQVRNISNSPKIDFIPTWSPDKNYLAFISNRDHSDNDSRGGDIFLFNVNDSTLINLTPGDEHEYFPSWSPDGKSIVFIREQAIETDPPISDIFIVDIQTRAITNITNGGLIAYLPIFSPNGRHIAVVSRDETRDDESNADIYLINIDGSNVRRLTNDGSFSYDLKWSPNGEYLSYIAEIPTSERSEAALHVLRVSNNEILSLDTHRLSGLLVDWSPDSRKIAFTGYISDDDSDIFIWDVTHLTVTQLEHGGNTYDFSPVWSPDGLQIVSFSEADDEGYGILYIYSLNQQSYALDERAFRFGSSETWWGLFFFQQLDW